MIAQATWKCFMTELRSMNLHWWSSLTGGRPPQARAIARRGIPGHFTGFECHRLQSSSVNATAVWQTPQNFFDLILSIEYFAVPC